MNTLAALNKGWIFWLDRAGIYALPLGGITTMFLVPTQGLSWSFCLSIVVGVSLTCAIAHHLCLYHLVKCPECGWNLTKFKDGKRIQPKYVYNAFRAGRPCLKCGWEPGKPAAPDQ
ncbi:hypothetical protein IC617_06680 [Neiella sp. HB171785]|uniref:Uncharacterized protein n=1 Tax=Neiella litorisoli TaxID=2771431 RepID=A0A8J6R2N8_9GAMM|nr:hypothetical protein [Neiella litorisoli]MBD1389110.1 hypothetical protein [Neiella litorisoli]